MLVYKKIQVRWILAVIFSACIGLVVTLILGGTLKMSFEKYVWNIGYSLSIGLPLFANGFLFERFAQHYIDWIRRPMISLFSVIIFHFIYSSFVIFSVNWFWFIIVQHKGWGEFWIYNKGTIISEYIIFIIVASIIYASSFFKAWRFEVQESAKIKNEALSLKYQVLQNQINPHFLFNSLNILGSLIDIDVKRAKEFTRELSLFYRDLLTFKDKDLISLKEESNFVRKYIYLQQIRFGEALQVEIIANENINGKVIPLSLQALVENAIKHNEISKANPLKIIIAITDDYELIVENNLQPKNSSSASSKTGLKNLAGRYEFLTGKEVSITTNNNYFRVILPLILMEKS